VTDEPTRIGLRALHRAEVTDRPLSDLIAALPTAAQPCSSLFLRAFASVGAIAIAVYPE
jgi:hypothetical protein